MIGWLAALASLAPLAPALLVPLYTRIRAEDALHHGRRAAILDLLAEGPRSFAEIRMALDVDRSTVEHHASHLVRAGRVVRRRVGRRWWLALPGQSVSLQVVDAREWVIETLHAHGETPRALLHALAERRGLARRSVNQAIQELAAAGAIFRRLAGTGELLRAGTDDRPSAPLLPLERHPSPSAHIDVDDGRTSAHEGEEAARVARAAGWTRRDGGAPPRAGEAEGDGHQALPRGGPESA